ncbi:MAG: NfeD family protein [Hahellaceae bacterium]|nr:NfeD family protein [Hahellaceae bacterium]MCP5211636.1 NfeD family protein [Hahellaceae bacterium]
MIEWLNTAIEYWHWLVFGMLLIIGEVFLSGFILFWFGLSALFVGGMMLILTLTFQTQLFIWAGMALIAIVIWLKFIKPRWKDRTHAGMGQETMLGQVGLVIESNAGKNRGRLRFPAPLLGEDEWVFISDTDEAVGNKVKVTDISGNSLIVTHFS